MTRERIGIVLAAGKGTRLKSELPKVLHSVLGKSMLQRVLESFVGLKLDRVVLIVGHQSERVQDAVRQWPLPFQVSFVVQEPQLGTGHALMQVVPELPVSAKADVLITCGDMPLVPGARYQALMETQARSPAAVTMVSVALDNPTGYGRVVEQNGVFQRIVEEKDATPVEKQIPWVNAGIYAADWQAFSPYFSKLSQDNAQGEFYLTDVLGLIVAEQGAGAVAVENWPDPDEILGINSRQQLAEAAAILSRWTAERLMQDGVSLVNPASMTLAPEVEIGPDTVLHPGCVLEGRVRIGRDCEVGPYTVMRGDIRLGDHCRVIYSMLDRAVTVEDYSYLGPFAHLRDNAFIGERSRIGNFVEVKETRFGSRSNAAHLCYLGDADVGDDVNMGAGSIIANYDPVRDIKHRSMLADHVKVGCNSVLISPVTLHERSSVAAGSVITHDVNAGDLAIARCRQTTLPGWVDKTLEQKQAASPQP